MAGHGSTPDPDRASHPGRQVGRSSFGAALDIRTAEYDAARAGTMTPEQMQRVGINPNNVRHQARGSVQIGRLRPGTPDPVLAHEDRASDPARAAARWDALPQQQPRPADWNQQLDRSAADIDWKYGGKTS